MRKEAVTFKRAQRFFVHFQLTSFPGAFKNSARCSTHVHNEQLTEKTLQNKLLEMD